MTSRTGWPWSVDEPHVAVGDDADQQAVARRRPGRRRCGSGRTARRRRARVSSGEQVTGLVTMPASDRFTRSTWSAWSSIERLRCSTPMPPWRAMAIAIRASVTVSIALDTSGIGRLDVAGQPARGVDAAGHDVGLGRQQQHVVEGQARAAAGWPTDPWSDADRSPATSAGARSCDVPALGRPAGAAHRAAPGARAHVRASPTCRARPSAERRDVAPARRAAPRRGVPAVGDTVEACTTSRIDPFAGDPAIRRADLDEPATTRDRPVDRRRAPGRARRPRRPGDLPGAAGADRRPWARHRLRGLPRAALLRLGPAAGQPAPPARRRAGRGCTSRPSTRTRTTT